MSISGFLLSSQLPTCTMHTLGNKFCQYDTFEFLTAKAKSA